MTEPMSRVPHASAQRRDQLHHQQQQQQQLSLMPVQPAKPSNDSVFIVKPDEGSQGEGIYLIQATTHVVSRTCIASFTVLGHIDDDFV